MVLCCTSKIFHQSAFSCFYPPLSFYWSTLFLLKKCKKWVIYLQKNFRSQKNKQHIVEKDLLPLDSITRTISDEICNIWLREFTKYLQMILKDHKNSKGKETKALSIFQYSVSGWLATCSSLKQILYLECLMCQFACVLESYREFPVN